MKIIVFALCLMPILAIGQDGPNPEDVLKKNGISLPVPAKPVANYVTSVKTGNLLFLSGHGFCGQAGPYDIGKVGKDLTVEEGYQAARNVGLCMLATLKDALGDLNKVKRIVRVFGLVNCTPEFGDQPRVINGFSDLMVEVFGPAGKHVRAAVGTNALPNNIAVEIEMVVELKEE